MNLKRAISLPFLFLVNIVLLAHLIIPHHYHEHTGVCFSLHCKDSHDAHRHDPQDKQPHQHEGSPNSDKCEYVCIYTPADKNEKDVCCLKEKFVFANVRVIFAFHFKYETISIVFYSFNPHFYANYISCSLGLRAPPVS